MAREAIQQSRCKHRAKYEAYAHVTLARARTAQGKKTDALAELQHALAIADRLANPALEVMVGAALLLTEPNEDVALSSGRAVERVLSNLSDQTLRDRFLHDEAIRAIRSARTGLTAG